jgi:hypothetical protein
MVLLFLEQAQDEGSCVAVLGGLANAAPSLCAAASLRAEDAVRAVEAALRRCDGTHKFGALSAALRFHRQFESDRWQCETDPPPPL